MKIEVSSVLNIHLPELESRPKSLRLRPRRDRDFEQTLETRPKFRRSETETRHETFETKRLQYFTNIFDSKFWTFGELPKTLQDRFLGISLSNKKKANQKLILLKRYTFVFNSKFFWRRLWFLRFNTIMIFKNFVN